MFVEDESAQQFLDVMSGYLTVILGHIMASWMEHMVIIISRVSCQTLLHHNHASYTLLCGSGDIGFVMKTLTIGGLNNIVFLPVTQQHVQKQHEGPPW